MEVLMSKKRLAKVLSISERKIDEDKKKGMPHVKLGTAVRYDFEKVMKWYKEMEVK